jgi:putative ATPase
LQNERFLRNAGDTSGKIWDEDALASWENADNGGEPWEGRAKAPDIDPSMSDP